MHRTPRRLRRRRSRRLRQAPGEVSAVSSSSTVSSLKDWPAADCAHQAAVLQADLALRRIHRRTLKAWVRKCCRRRIRCPCRPGGQRPSLHPAWRRSRGRSGQQAGQGQGHCVLHTDFLWQRLNDPVIFRGSFAAIKAQCQGNAGRLVFCKSEGFQRNFSRNRASRRKPLATRAPVFGPTRSSRPRAVLERLQPKARRSAKALAAQKLSPEGWPRIRRTFFGGMSRSTPLRVASEVCARHLVGESRPGAVPVAPHLNRLDTTRATCSAPLLISCMMPATVVIWLLFSWALDSMVCMLWLIC